MPTTGQWPRVDGLQARKSCSNVTLAPVLLWDKTRTPYSHWNLFLLQSFGDCAGWRQGNRHRCAWWGFLRKIWWAHAHCDWYCLSVKQPRSSNSNQKNSNKVTAQRSSLLGDNSLHLASQILAVHRLGLVLQAKLKTAEIQGNICCNRDSLELCKVLLYCPSVSVSLWVQICTYLLMLGSGKIWPELFSYQTGQQYVLDTNLYLYQRLNRKHFKVCGCSRGDAENYSFGINIDFGHHTSYSASCHHIDEAFRGQKWKGRSACGLYV